MSIIPVSNPVLTDEQTARRDALERRLNNISADIASLMAKRDRIASEIRKLSITYAKYETEFAPLIGTVMDNSKLISMLQAEEAAYQARLKTGEW